MNFLQPLNGFLADGFHCLMTFSLLSSHFISTASSTYNPHRLHYRENFDPAEADPKRNISCVGDSYDIELPMLGDFNPNGQSMQKLCAKPQYGGGAPNLHAGAYCYEPINTREDYSDYSETGIEYIESGFSMSDDDDDNEDYDPLRLQGKIMFDPLRGARASQQLQNSRFMQACIYRCFCNFGIEDISIHPPSNHLAVRPWPSDGGYMLQIDINNDFTVPKANKMGSSGGQYVNSAIIFKLPQTDRRGAGYLLESTHMNLDPGNYIECTGDLPNFVFPPPYTRAHFSSIQELCAVSLSGGNTDANAGGYCHRSAGSSSTATAVESTVWFSDSMTPRNDWTWGGGSFFFTASIRYHCWRSCACKLNPPQDPDTTKLWNFITGLELRLHDDGSVDLTPSGSRPQAQGLSTGSQVLPPQPQGASNIPSGTCGANKTDFCPKAWDTAAWGPIPRQPLNVTDVVKPSPPKAGVMGVCGNNCTGPSDCGTTEDQYSCSCAFPSLSDSRLLGLDPATPSAVCLALFSSVMHGGLKGLAGRDLKEYVDQSGLPHSCRCNETVVADACCESRDGMVWMD